MSSSPHPAPLCPPRPQPESSASRKRNILLYSPICMVVVGFAVRVAFLLITRSYRVDGHWQIWEMSEIGQSLAFGFGFASPWGGGTGPTAWTAPVYPFMVAGVLRLFGRTDAAAFTLFTINSIFSALTCWTIYRIGLRVFNRRVAAWSGWAWALFPWAIYWSVEWIWETTLSTFLLSLLFLLTLEMEGDNRLWSWFRYGALWGFVALCNTSILSFLPFAGCWLAYRLYKAGKPFLRPVLLSALLFWAVITPWLVRNYVVFHKFIFIRSDFGSELRAGNNPEAVGTWVQHYRVGNNYVLFNQYRQMGEVSFDAEQGRLAKQWIAENPRRFLWLCYRRVYFFWTGWPERETQRIQPIFIFLSLLGIGGLLAALRRRIHGVFLFASLLAFYPLVYYMVFPTDRYHHPIEPILMVLSVWLLLTDRAAGKRDKSPPHQAVAQ